jgi:hypothetical protein
MALWWTQLSAPPWASRAAHGSIVQGGSWYVWSGANGATQRQDTWVTTDARNWTLASADTALWDSSSLVAYAAGATGVFNYGGTGLVGSRLSFFNGLAWSDLGFLPFEDLSGPFFQLATLLRYGGFIWKMGGSNPGLGIPVYSDVVLRSATGASGTWSTIHAHNGAAIWPHRWAALAFEWQGEMYIACGSNQSGALSDLWKTTNGSAWTRLANVPVLFSYVAAGVDGVYFAPSTTTNRIYKTRDFVTYELVTAAAPWPSTLSGFKLNYFQNRLYLSGGSVGGVAVNTIYESGLLIPAASGIFPSSTAKPSHARILRGHRSPDQAQAFHEAMRVAV